MARLRRGFPGVPEVPALKELNDIRDLTGHDLSVLNKDNFDQIANALTNDRYTPQQIDDAYNQLAQVVNRQDVNPDTRGRKAAVGGALLDAVNAEAGTKTNFGGYREMDEVFDSKVSRYNADEVVGALGARTPVSFNGSEVVGGDLITDKKGRINLDTIPSDATQLSRTAPDAVNTDVDKRLGAMLYPERMTDVPPELKRAHAIGKAMMAGDPAAYKKAGMPIEVDRDAAEYITEKMVKGKNNTPLRSTGFVGAGGLGSESRGQILIPGTDVRYNDADKETQKAYKNKRAVDFMQQWLGQGGASIGNPSSVIVPPGKKSHMDHVQSLSSSIDTIGEKGWGYSDDPTNFSYLDEEANVHSKLNYGIQGQHLMMRIADDMRRQGLPFPARLSQSELGDPNRRRLTDEEGAIRLATDKLTMDQVTPAGEKLLDIIQYLNRNN